MLKMRNYAIDIAKGLCILLMILGHCQGMNPIVYRAIESFHMPFFFIAAGFFFRPQPFISIAQKSFKRLIVPMLIGVAVCIAIYLALGETDSAFNWAKALLFPGGTGRKIFFYPNWPCLGVFWFLAALFWCRIIYAKIDQLCPNNILLICALLSWATIIVGRRIILPLGISEGLSGLCFYAIGYFANQRKVQSISLKWYTVILIIALWLVDIHFVGFRMFQLGYTWYLYPIGVVFACLMSWLIYQFSKKIGLYKWSNSLRLCGLFSLEMMCCHQIARVIAPFVYSSLFTHTMGAGFAVNRTIIIDSKFLYRNQTDMY